MTNNVWQCIFHLTLGRSAVDWNCNFYLFMFLVAVVVVVTAATGYGSLPGCRRSDYVVASDTLFNTRGTTDKVRRLSTLRAAHNPRTTFNYR